MNNSTLINKAVSQRSSSLDIDPAAVRVLADRVDALVFDYFQSIRERPVFPRVAAGDVAQILGRELPLEGQDLDHLAGKCASILDAGRHNGHPRFFGYVASPSTAPGAYADLLASAVNQNLTCWRSSPSGTEVERLVIDWLAQLTGFGAQSAGLLMSGGSMANLSAIHIAQRAKSDPDVSRTGLRSGGKRLIVYTSDQVHHSVPKAADILGIGTDQVRQVETDEKFRMDVGALRHAIERDISLGFLPCCVVGTAGTVNTGAVDPLREIAAVAREFNLWFHVDGAYGAPAAMVPEKRSLFDGVELADSLSVDAHKWLYSPVDCGCLLIRDPVSALRTYSESSVADYTKISEEGIDEAFAFWDYGPELSRRFRALKVWFMFSFYGINRIKECIAEDNRLAGYMSERIAADDELELLAPPSLSICCFRYVPPEWKREVHENGHGADFEHRLNRLNEELMLAVQRSGQAYLSNASLNGRYALRACIVNFRTTESDIELTLHLVRDLGRRFSSQSNQR